MHRVICLAAAMLVLQTGPAIAAAPTAAPAVAESTAGAPQRSGLDLTAFDPGVRAQDDLFGAVNGQWIRNTPIPGDKGSYGAFEELGDRADARVRAIVEELAARRGAAGNEQKIGSYYRSFMDEAAIDKAGLKPVRPWFAQIDAVGDRRQLARLLGRMQGVFATPLPVAVGPDDKEPDVNRAQTWQGGLGLPDRDYYLKDDERYAQARAAYLVYLESLLRLAGQPQSAPAAAQVFAFEKRLAEAQWSRVDNRDPQKLYNVFTPAALAEAAPGLDWAVFFKAAALPVLDKLIVSQPSYAFAAAKAVAEVPLPVWKLYLRVRVLDGGADVLPKPFREARFAFHGAALRGLTQDKPRWQKATDSLDGALGEAVGQIYVARHFPPAHKARMQTLVDNLLAAYRQSIGGLAWMGPETQKRAQDKLATYGSKIGYPEVWRDYRALVIKDADAFGNDTRSSRFGYERNAVRAGRPVDRREWGMTPQTVNAYYSPNFNEIVFPAAILDKPFFDVQADDAVNYGAIGAIIGHEISHGFDDQGSQYDGDGKLNNWWTDADRKAFEALADRLVAQYGSYEPLPGHTINGRLTLGENIADLSGLQIAYKAYKISLGGKAAPVLDGFSGEQRFFMGWAQAWRTKMRAEQMLQQLTSNPHSPPEFRVDGVVVNHDAFHEAFGTKPGDALYKPGPERVRIW
jgi:putative endopeptidase